MRDLALAQYDIPFIERLDITFFVKDPYERKIIVLWNCLDQILRKHQYPCSKAVSTNSLSLSDDHAIIGLTAFNLHPQEMITILGQLASYVSNSIVKGYKFISVAVNEQSSHLLSSINFKHELFDIHE